MHNLLIQRPQSVRSLSRGSLNSSRKDKQEQAKELFLKGKKKQSQAQHFQALEHYIKATIYDPQYFEALCNMGSCYRSLGKYMQAKNCYLRSLKVNPKDQITRYNLANLYRIIGDYQEGIKHYGFIIQHSDSQRSNLSNLYINTLINAGISYKNLGLYQQAIKLYQKVNLLAPSDEGGFYNHAMVIISLLQKNTVKKVANFDKQLANKANLLFDQVQLLNQSNKMVKIARIKLKVLVDRQYQTLNSALQQLKLLKLETSYESLVNYVNQVINFCQNLEQQNKTTAVKIKHSEGKAEKIVKPQISINGTKNIFSQFLSFTEDYLNAEILTEEKGIQMIEKGNYAELSNLLKNLDDKNKMKHTLQLILQLQKNQKSNKSLDKAYQIYKKHFTLPDTGECIPFEQISSKGHQALGRLFNLKNNYSEATLHFQFSSQMIKKKSESSAAQHNEIGEGLEAAGSMLKAIEEYHLAFQLQPKNEKISYNLGYCLFQNGRYEEALYYFNAFLETLKGNNELNDQQRQIWQTQCLILMALASIQRPQSLSSFHIAYKTLKQLRKKFGQPEIQQQQLLSFFQNFATTLQNHFSISYAQDLNLNQTQQLLIDVYSQLLSFSNCADRETILINVGNLAYQSRRFLQAVQSFQQIKTTPLIPYQKIALCYLRLVEPVMTLKYIQLQLSINKSSKRTQFISQVIEWIYYNENVGTLNSQLPTVRQDFFFQRNQFGIGLIEKFEFQIKKTKAQSTSMISRIIDELLKDSRKVMLKQDMFNLKFEKVYAIFAQQKSEQLLSTDIIPQKILHLCFNRSENVSRDLTQILEFLHNLPTFGGSTSIIQALIYIFIYQNQKDSHKIRDLFVQQTKSNKKLMQINIQRINYSDSQFLQIYADFDTLKRLVFVLIQWQQVLSPEISQILDLISHIYYQTDICKCLESQYHFPRHWHISQCDDTLNKMFQIVIKVLKFDRKWSCSGSNIHQMKKQLLKNFQYQFNTHIKYLKLKSISLSPQFLPLTLHAFHKSRKESLKFVKSLLELGNGVKVGDIQDCDEYQLIINSLVRVRCRWEDPLSNTAITTKVMRKIVDNPLFMANQSLIELEKLLQIVKLYCPNANSIIKQDHSLDF